MPARGGPSGSAGACLHLRRQLVAATPLRGRPNGHSSLANGLVWQSRFYLFPLREISAAVGRHHRRVLYSDKNAPEGTMQFHTPAGLDTAEFKADIAY